MKNKIGNERFESLLNYTEYMFDKKLPNQDIICLYFFNLNLIIYILINKMWQ